MWTRITVDQKPQENKVFLTKIEDANGERNIQQLKRVGNLYFHPDGKMYVYYTPTHYQTD